MNLDEIRKRLEELTNKGQKKGGKNVIWKATGEHQLRCLPQKDSDPFIERFFHYDINGKTVVCPKNFSNDCSICEFAEKLRSWNDENGKPKQETLRKNDFEFFKKIQSKPRYFVAVIERGKEDDGVKYWSLTSRNYEDLLKICINEDWNEGREDGGGSNVLVSTSSAHDLTVSFKAPGEKGNKTSFKLTEITERKKPSKLHEDKKEVDRILASIPSLNDAHPEMSSKEVHKMFMDFVSGGAGSDGESTDGKKDKEYAPKETKAETKSHNNEKLTGKKSIDDAFDELMAEE